MKPVQQAKLLTEQGFRVIPTKGKVPDVAGFTADDPDFTCGPEWFADPGTEIAILCGRCPALGEDYLLCLDFDGDFEAVPELAAFWGLLTDTLISHDAAHMFYRVAAADAPLLKQWVDVFSTKKLHSAALDLKWSGGYAVEQWDWLEGTDTSCLADQISPLPRDALLAIVAAQAKVERAARAPVAGERGEVFLRSIGCDPAAVEARAVEWLTTEAYPAIEGQNGSNQLLYVCSQLAYNFGLDEDTMFDLLLEHYNPRCEPEWSDAEIDRKITECTDVNIDVPFGRALLVREMSSGAALLAEPVRKGPPLLALPTPAALAKLETPDQYLATWNAHLIRNQKQEVKNLVFNTVYTLQMNPYWRGVFAYDEFSHEVVFMRDSALPEDVQFKAGDIFDEDNHPEGMRAWFGRQVHEPSPSEMIAAVHKVAKENSFHAVRAYLEGLRGTWDGVDRNLVNYLGAEPSVYQRAVCAKWLRSAVARVMQPGCKSDCMLILEGEQGWKKSTAIKCLCPDVRWFYEVSNRNVGAKDFMQEMRGKWLCEIPEVDQLIKSRDESELKGLLSRTVDTYRPSYARKAKDFQRQLVFAGTTNEHQYLRDASGNRRYQAVLCCALGPIREGDICDDRDQLWAQALTEYESGMQHWLTAGEDALARDEQDDRMEMDPWADLLAGWLEDQKEPFTTIQALAGLPAPKDGSALDQRDANRMGKILRKLGYRNYRARDGGRRTTKWQKPGVDHPGSP